MRRSRERAERMGLAMATVISALIPARALIALISLPIALFAVGAAAADPPPLKHLTIIAPSATGGGYDLTAQAMKRSLESTGIVDAVTVTRSPGAGGLLGLTELVTAHAGDGDVLLIGGMVMMAATTSNRAAISLLNATPLARLAAEYDVVAVPAESPYRTLDDLLDAMRASPGSIRWVGGSSGGTDELLVRGLARVARVDPLLMHYTALPGGGEIITHLLQGQVVAGVSGLIEMESMIQKGELRGLAVSSARRLAGVDIPTFDELGISGLSLTNWRGVFAAPGIQDEDRRKLAVAIDSMVHSDAWRSELARHHWENAYLSGARFTGFLGQQDLHARGGSLLESSASPQLLPRALARRFWWMLVAVFAAVTLPLALWIQHARGAKREIELRQALQEVSRDAERRTREMQGLLAGVSSHIEREFVRWGLSGAERGVASLMLKGLPLKQIATLRNTSGRTVRQQAQAIYRKAGLDGRCDLAAYFLEEFLAPIELRGALNDGALTALTARVPASANPMH